VAYDANVLNIHDNKNHIPTLADTAEKLIICADAIREIAKSFVYSSNREKGTYRKDYEKFS